MSENRVINQVVLLPVVNIFPNPGQPRRSFSEDSLSGLAKSIEETGLLCPISVRETIPGVYELIAGERRLRAYRLLGYEKIPALIEKVDDTSGRLLPLIENLQRDDLNCFEQAQAMCTLMKEHGLTQSDIARRLGMAQSTIANKLRLMRLPDAAQEKILEYQFTERHARCLLQIESPVLLMDAIEQIHQRQLNVAQTEHYVQILLEKQKPKPTRVFILKDVRIFFNTINKAIETMKLAGIPAQTQREEDEEYINLTVKIPKSAAVKKSTA